MLGGDRVRWADGCAGGLRGCAPSAMKGRMLSAMPRADLLNSVAFKSENWVRAEGQGKAGQGWDGWGGAFFTLHAADAMLTVFGRGVSRAKPTGKEAGAVCDGLLSYAMAVCDCLFPLNEPRSLRRRNN